MNLEISMHGLEYTENRIVQDIYGLDKIDGKIW